MKNIQQSYDEIPYKSYAHANSSIYKLEGIATFLGLSPVPVNQARILEIGCSSGGNLITTAIENPNSTFVGIDLSNIQIHFGHQAIKQLELKNLSLYQMDVLELANKFRHDSPPPTRFFSKNLTILSPTVYIVGCQMKLKMRLFIFLLNYCQKKD
ncbi:hypothetical protein CEP49_02280 [Mergibacter septicus]|uniref:methyltransferase domain-containing protein n=1 Tax=Mergibacter septicus TaxID=221402 RepID=UPI0011790421|nr:methyltransferase domain-containing protein [Mergibacter septicus]AWX13457.1 hypothetical protein CEP49_02280 [Mergibacter septicus]